MTGVQTCALPISSICAASGIGSVRTRPQERQITVRRGAPWRSRSPTISASREAQRLQAQADAVGGKSAGMIGTVAVLVARDRDVVARGHVASGAALKRRAVFPRAAAAVNRAGSVQVQAPVLADRPDAGAAVFREP